MKLKAYVKQHWKSLYVQGYGMFIAIFLAVGGVAVGFKVIPNIFPDELQTILLLLLVAIQQLDFFSKIAKNIAEKEAKT